MAKKLLLVATIFRQNNVWRTALSYQQSKLENFLRSKGYIPKKDRPHLWTRKYRDARGAEHKLTSTIIKPELCDEVTWETSLQNPNSPIIPSWIVAFQYKWSVTKAIGFPSKKTALNYLHGRGFTMQPDGREWRNVLQQGVRLLRIN
jgi:hypothetical protein